MICYRFRLGNEGNIKNRHEFENIKHGVPTPGHLQ